MGFCPRCGKQTEHQFCEACLRELKPLVKRVNQVNAILCPVCSKTFTTIWSKRPLQQTLEKNIQRKIEFAQAARIDALVLEEASLQPGKQLLQLTVVGSADAEGPAYEEYYEIPVLVEGKLCNECQQLANAYFTGILQLRNPNDEVQGTVERWLGKHLSNVKDVTGGIDYYVTDHRVLQNVAQQIHEEFGGELTIRAQHFSYDSQASKNLYRVNACIRLPKFWRGSVIQAPGKLLLVTRMGKRLKGIDLETGKNLTVACKNKYPEYPVHDTTLVTSHPVTVLHPETMQTVTIMNPTIALTDKVRVALVNDQVYLLP